MTEDALVQKLKILRRRFQAELDILEKALLEAHKNLQVDIDKKKLTKISQSLGKK